MVLYCQCLNSLVEPRKTVIKKNLQRHWPWPSFLASVTFPRTVMWFPFDFSTTMFTVTVLIFFNLWYFDFRNLNAVLDWQVGLIILLIKWLIFTVSSQLLVSSRLLLAFWTLVQILPFLSTMIFKF